MSSQYTFPGFDPAITYSLTPDFLDLVPDLDDIELRIVLTVQVLGVPPVLCRGAPFDALLFSCAGLYSTPTIHAAVDALISDGIIIAKEGETGLRYWPRFRPFPFDEPRVEDQPPRTRTPLQQRRQEFQKVHRRLARVVFARDGHACLRCGSTEQLTVDHIHAMSKGGGDELENLQTLCYTCNVKKGAR